MGQEWRNSLREDRPVGPVQPRRRDGLAQSFAHHVASGGPVMSPSLTPYVKRLRSDPFGCAVGQAVDLVLKAIQKTGSVIPSHPGLFSALEGINKLMLAARLSSEFVNPSETPEEEAERKRLFFAEADASLRAAWMPEKKCLSKESGDRCDTATGNTL